MNRYEKETARRLLRDVFGADDFRPGQEQAIACLCAGHDLICLFPTGAGKSLVYQLPALMINAPVLVVSPLIALMRDQVASLQRRGVDALCLDSLQTEEEHRSAMERIRAGQARLIYVSPERLRSFSFQEALRLHPPGLAVIDEAHCVVQWGESFRPAYAGIGVFLRALPRRPVLLAMTATAGRAMLRDISKSLAMRHPRLMTLPLLRENLRYAIHTTIRPTDWLRSYAAGHADEKGLIFCRTRAETERLARELREGSPGLRAACYHAGLPREERDRVQEAFRRGELDVLTATSAFGMGIDIPDIRYAVHRSPPESVPDMAQQSGRAGRDGLLSECVLLLDPRDIERQRRRLQHERMLAGHDRGKLGTWKQHVRERRQVLRILLGGRCIPARMAAAFGQRQKPCGICSACLGQSRRVPVPRIGSPNAAQLRLWALKRLRRDIAENPNPGRVLPGDRLARAARTGFLQGDERFAALLRHMQE